LLLVALKTIGALRYWREGNQMSDRFIVDSDLERNYPYNWRVWDTENNEWATFAHWSRQDVEDYAEMLNGRLPHTTERYKQHE